MKLIILRSVSLFDETPENMLAELGSLLEEVVLEAGVTLFEYGDHGDTMYIFVDGRVRVHLLIEGCLMIPTIGEGRVEPAER